MGLIRFKINGTEFLAKENDTMSFIELVQAAFPPPESSITYTTKGDPNDFLHLHMGDKVWVRDGMEFTVTPKR